MKNRGILGSVIIILTTIFLFFSSISLFNNSSYAEEKNTEKIDKTDIATKEVIECSKEDPCYIDENEIEIDAQVEQENISFDGENNQNGTSLLGQYKGLTYYSQSDSRWANTPYTITGNSSQTMKSSGCGPTAAAMIVSSAKGSILPDEMAKIFVNNGYRTKNNGTAWSAFSFIADYFEFREFYTTSSFNEAMNYLSKKNENGTNKYYIVASCGSGLFTNGGHYIVLTSLNENTIHIYDPYLYNGKFNISSRKNANVITSGNNVYVTKQNFKKYANYKNFWIFSNDSEGSQTSIDSKKIDNINYERYVATKSSNLNVRLSNNIKSNIVTKLKKGTKVNVVEINGDWSRINEPVNGWVNSFYLSSIKVNNNTEKVNTNTAKIYTKGKYKTITNIHVRNGAGTNYKIKKFNQLTQNAKKQNEKMGNKYYNGYKKGVVCDVIKVEKNWGLTRSGWICLDYCKKIQ